jgi:hypothetical protein
VDLRMRVAPAMLQLLWMTGLRLWRHRHHQWRVVPPTRRRHGAPMRCSRPTAAGTTSRRGLRHQLQQGLLLGWHQPPQGVVPRVLMKPSRGSQLQHKQLYCALAQCTHIAGGSSSVVRCPSPIHWQTVFMVHCKISEGPGTLDCQQPACVSL